MKKIKEYFVSLGKKCSWKKCDVKMDKNVKISLFVALIIVIGAVCWYCRGAFIAVSVDGRPISRWEVMRGAEKESGKMVLDSLVSKQLLENAERKNNITVSKEEVDFIFTKLEESFKSQGGTLDSALSEQGMTKDQLRKEIIDQEKLKKLLGDKVAVSEAEALKYMKDNKLTAPAGSEADFVTRVKEYLSQKKMASATEELLTSLRSEASIKYFVSY